MDLKQNEQAQAIVALLKQDSIGRTDADLIQPAYGISIRDKNKALVELYQKDLQKVLAQLVQEGFIELEYDYYFFKKDLPAMVKHDPDKCVNCGEAKDGYSSEDGQGGHGWTCNLCGYFNCEWGC